MKKNIFKKVVYLVALLIVFAVTGCTNNTESKVDSDGNKNSAKAAEAKSQNDSKSEEAEEEQKQEEKNEEVKEEVKEVKEESFADVYELLNSFKDWENFFGFGSVTYSKMNSEFSIPSKNETLYKVAFKSTDGKEASGEISPTLRRYEPTVSGDEIVEERYLDSEEFLMVGNIHYRPVPGFTEDGLFVMYDSFEDFNNKQKQYPLIGFDFPVFSIEPNDAEQSINKNFENQGQDLIKAFYNKKQLLGEFIDFAKKNNLQFTKDSDKKFTLKIKANDLDDKVAKFIDHTGNSGYVEYHKWETLNDNGKVVNNFNRLQEDGKDLFNQRYSIFEESIGALFDVSEEVGLRNSNLQLELSFEKTDEENVIIYYKLINEASSGVNGSLAIPGHQIGMSFKITLQKSDVAFNILKQNIDRINRSYTVAKIESLPEGYEFHPGNFHALYLDGEDNMLYVEGVVQSEEQKTAKYWLDSLKKMKEDRLSEEIYD